MKKDVIKQLIMFMCVMFIILVISNNSFAESTDRPPAHPSIERSETIDATPVSNKPTTTPQVKKIEKTTDANTTDRPPAREATSVMERGAVIGKDGYPEVSIKEITPTTKHKELTGLNLMQPKGQTHPNRSFKLKKIHPNSLGSK